MSSRNLTSVGSEDASTCADCGKPLTAREQYLGDACEKCEREYQLETTDPDDLYPRAA
jgi:predicted amidophosphoribosyltransferase